MLAGASSRAGIRHGVYAGFLGAAGVMALAGSYGDLVAPGGYIGDEINLASSDPNNLTALAIMAISVFGGGVLGGWLGGTLFLPLAPRHMRHRTHRLSDD
jgi:hypothetical protein